MLPIPLSGTLFPALGSKLYGCIICPCSHGVTESDAKSTARNASVRITTLYFTMGFLHERLPREHHGEENQNSYGSDVHQDLSHTHEGRVQEYVQCGNARKCA